MDSQLISIHYGDPLWIAMAFICGLAISKVGLPPLIGFLLAGFALNALGAESGQFLSAVAELGITLLLFSIGLKLKFSSLIRPEVWGVTTLHMALVTALMTGSILLLSTTGLPLIAGLDWQSALLIGFALSFSSTVFAIKMLDELGATSSRHGTTSIGVLVVQDFAAVVFIAFSVGTLPSPLALGLVALIPLRLIIHWILDKVGHGELLVLFGVTMALIGADIFELVEIKGDVGALVFGMLLAGHAKANELSKALFGFKELFLVGFFLSVGMTALPGWTELVVAAILILFLPFKVVLYFVLFSLFRLRASTSWRTSLNLANFSEFGLIVGALAVSTGWLASEWLAVFAVAISISFILLAPLVNVRDNLYQKWRPELKRFERPERLSGEETIDLGHFQAVVFGMGRMGAAAYNAMGEDYRDRLVGVEIDLEKTEQHRTQGRNVVNGDATNPDFWTRAPDLTTDLEMVLLTLPTHKANMVAASRLRELGYRGDIAATSKYPDEEDELKAVGVEHTFNIYTEAGLGFANGLRELIGDKRN